MTLEIFCRRFLFAVIMLISLFLLYQKRYSNYAKWSQLFLAIDKTGVENVSFYFSPNYATNIPPLIASLYHLNSKFAHMKRTEPDTMEDIKEDVKRNKRVIYIKYRANAEDEKAREKILFENKYRKQSLNAENIEAMIYSKNQPLQLFRNENISLEKGTNSILTWVNKRIDARKQADETVSIMDTALAARIKDNGEVQEAVFYLPDPLIKQYGRWNLSEENWQYVAMKNMKSGQFWRENMIYAHPAEKEVLAVVFPNTALKKTLDLTYGISDDVVPDGSPVVCDIFLNNEPVGKIVALPKPGWRHSSIPTTKLENAHGNLIFLITATNSRGRHFGFSFKSLSKPVFDETIKFNNKTLADQVAKLKVRRQENGQAAIQTFTFEKAPMTAEEMHEKKNEADIELGGISERWLLASREFEVVGRTLQKSGGVVRRGIWAHPKDGTTLLIEVDNLKYSKGLFGFFGFTDQSLEKSKERNIKAPVNVEVLINGRSIFKREIRRESGWRDVRLTAGGNILRTGDTVVIKINAPSDSWAHFIFNLAETPFSK